jgi:hypothetical protein
VTVVVGAAPVYNVLGTVVTATSITLRWAAGSVLTRTFRVYGRRTINSRDLPVGNNTLLQESTATVCAVTGLASGSFYTFTIVGVGAKGQESSGAEFTFQTASLAGQDGTLPPGGTCARGARDQGKGVFLGYSCTLCAHPQRWRCSTATLLLLLLGWFSSSAPSL